MANAIARTDLSTPRLSPKPGLTRRRAEARVCIGAAKVDDAQAPVLQRRKRRLIRQLLTVAPGADAIVGWNADQSGVGAVDRRLCDRARIAAGSVKGIAGTGADERAGLAVGVAAPAGLNFRCAAPLRGSASRCGDGSPAARLLARRVRLR